MAKHLRQSLSIHYQQQSSPPPSLGPAPRPPQWPAPDPGNGSPARPIQPPAFPLSSLTSPPPLKAVVLAGGSMLAAAMVGLSPHSGPVVESPTLTGECIKIEKTVNGLSRDRLKAMLALPVPAPQATLKSLLTSPYCVLKPSPNEQAEGLERQAYPLEFDPQTWLVVIYQGDLYQGYDFIFHP
ncbi:MAG: hypothetical protein KGQ93_02695 [Cyanobacteria bacterium REEB459]|nr:hypothetical protein [Cyanobacteria bacterium REEB459]